MEERRGRLAADDAICRCGTHELGRGVDGRSDGFVVRELDAAEMDGAANRNAERSRTAVRAARDERDGTVGIREQREAAVAELLEVLTVCGGEVVREQRGECAHQLVAVALARGSVARRRRRA